MVYKNIKTYKKEYLEVGDGHKIYYELSGNPDGQPVLFIHGGPGGGFSQEDKRFFNPKIFNIITFDQRGSGKSKPFASLKNNTTKFLVSDIKKLLSELKIQKTLIFGGSWGSTLALVYSIKYPETVTGLVLRGIFLGSKKENDYFTYNSYNTFPEAWEKLTSIIPESYIKKRKIEQYYYKKIKEKNQKFIKAWAEYEFSISSLYPSKTKVKKYLKNIKVEAFASIELHYLNHLCFLPENYILNNLKKIENIPCSIIHGRYDKVCCPSSAYKIHKKLKKSNLYFTMAGHSASDEENEQKLVEEINKMAKNKIKTS